MHTLLSAYFAYLAGCLSFSEGEMTIACFWVREMRGVRTSASSSSMGVTPGSSSAGSSLECSTMVGSSPKVSTPVGSSDRINSSGLVSRRLNSGGVTFKRPVSSSRMFIVVMLIFSIFIFPSVGLWITTHF